MLHLANRAVLAVIVLASITGISLSMLALFIPDLLEEQGEYQNLGHMDYREDFYLFPVDGILKPSDSPHYFNLTIHTPPLEENDQLLLQVYTNGKLIYYIDCLGGFEDVDEYEGYIELRCEAPVSYEYEKGGVYRVFGVFNRSGSEYAAGPVIVDADWREYEKDFLDFSWVLALIFAFIYLGLILPIGYLMLRVASKAKHAEDFGGEYSYSTLLNPFTGKSLGQKIHALLISPYFWALEILGAGLVLLYLAVSGEIWKSTSALIGFVFSGLISFIVPFLWCAAWWYADFREREPLRIMITFFFWGMFAALMSIGITSFSGDFFAVFGLSLLSVFLIAPIAEEFFKGSGLAVLSGHHEFDSVEDGMAFGFAIGMGFSFVEDWLYLMNNPLGADALSWFIVFILRSIFFSINHGFYTAITGGVIGYLKEKAFAAPALGLLIGFPVAALFHAIHNSSEALIALFGDAGAVLYLCFLIPVFDYGGFIVLMVMFIRAITRERPK